MRPLASIAVVAFAAATCSTRDAAADEVAACKASSEAAQAARTEGKLRVARARFLACARESCPAVVRNDCVREFEALERSQPSVVVRAQDARGHDVVGVRVEVDGEALQERLTGKAVDVDPGPHTFRFVAASGDRVEQVVLVAQGERERDLRVRFDTALTPGGAREAALADVHDRAAENTPAGGPARSWTPVVVFGAAGALGLASFGALHASGWSEYHDLRASGCGETRACDAGSTRAKFIAADVGLGIGILGVGVAAYFAIRDAAR